MTADQLDRHYAVNVRGTMLMAKAFLNQWPGGPGGRIVEHVDRLGPGTDGSRDRLRRDEGSRRGLHQVSLPNRWRFGHYRSMPSIPGQRILAG